MASDPTPQDGLRRLADQMQSLSQLAETLTYRLLELEERAVATELRLESLLNSQNPNAGLATAETGLRLGETEERLTRLEALLSGFEAPQGRSDHDESGLFEEDFAEPYVVDESFQDDLAVTNRVENTDNNEASQQFDHDHDCHDLRDAEDFDQDADEDTELDNLRLIA